MATGLRNATKPRRYDITMSRRTRKAGTANAVTTDCNQDQGMEIQSQMKMMQQQQQQDQVTQLKDLFKCATDKLKPQQPEDATQQPSSLQQSEDGHHEQTNQKLEKEDAGNQQQQCEDNSRHLSLQELIDDEPINGCAKVAANGSQEESSSSAAAADAVQKVAESSPAAAEAKQPEHVARKKKMIGLMRRYVKVRSIKPKPAPERNVAPIC
uniref:Uncharacterized protein n=1 Tax=Leersia perrieri TaxID=77586 RepID=A0A0D9V9N0_9ORYZ